jgi:uncharacterized protein (TIGR02246 family)
MAIRRITWLWRSCAALLCLSLLLPQANFAGEVDEPAAIQARLQRLEDLESIRQLLMDYGRTLDARDFAAYAALFTEDGEWIGGFGRIQGRTTIQAEMEKRLGVTPQTPGKSNHHLFMNESIEVDGDTAHAFSKWIFTITGEENRPALVYLGHYEDDLVRDGGAWKFKRRMVYGDIPFADPNAPQQ